MKTIVGQKAAIINNDNKLLILKRNKGYKRENTWDFPGGKLEELESLEENIKRELKEELGTNTLEILIQFHITLLQLDKNKRLVRIFNLCKTEDKITISEEHSEYKWVDLDEAKEYEYRSADFYEVIDKIKVLAANLLR